MTQTYRTSDGARWGVGKGSDLAPAEVDINFWDIIQRIIVIEALPDAAAGITAFSVSGTDFYVHLSDGTQLGPYTLPVATYRSRGAWTPLTSYQVLDTFDAGGALYSVLVDHVSDATFDPGANDGAGNDYYDLMLSTPASVIPSGGPTGAFLRKSSATDYASSWQDASLSELADVDVAAAADGQVLTFAAGTWVPETPEVSAGGTDLGIVITDPVAGQPLVFNGIEFVNSNTADMPSFDGGNVSGDVVIDRTKGEFQQVKFIDNVTSFNITGWAGAPGQGGRLVLLVDCNAASGKTWSWPNFLYWSNGFTVPTTSTDGYDIYTFITFDGGETIFASVVGQNYA